MNLLLKTVQKQNLNSNESIKHFKLCIVKKTFQAT